jgi:hypothetical protein
MDDLFTSAAVFLPVGQIQNSAKRSALLKELGMLLNESPFLTKGEKIKMAKVIPLFTDEILIDLKQTLLRQNLRFLQKRINK